MFKNITRFVAIGSVLAFSSCAGSYQRIHPERLTNYQSVTSTSVPVEFSYQYGALAAHGGNKKYTKKESKNGYQTVAVRIKNNTAQELNISRDLELYFGDTPIMPVPALQASQDLRQGEAIYLLYLLLNFRVGATQNPNTGQISGGTFIPTGPFIAAGNYIGASQANKNMRIEFVANDITNKTIKPGETVYGIVSLRETRVAPLRFVLRNNAGLQAAPTPAPAAPTGGN